MMSVLLIGLTLSVLFTFVLLVATFFNVAFERQAVTAPRDAWAGSLKRSATPRKSLSALTAQRVRSAGAATLPVAAERCSGCAHGCLHPQSCPIMVTPLEAIAMANFLKANEPADKLEAIRTAARLNSKRLAQGQAPADESLCPLLASDGSCEVDGLQPSACHTCDADRDNAAADAATVEGLRVAGLDTKRYELNAALVVALDTPSAADRWRHGEPIFSVGCHS